MNNPEGMEVTHAGHDPRQLRVRKNAKHVIRRIASGLTSCKRFAPGLDLAYSITFPFCIQGDTIRKE